MDTNSIIMVLVGLVTGMGGFIAAGFVKRQDRAESRDDKAAARQSAHSETLASVSTRVSSIESVVAQMAEVLARLARIEEWRELATPRLDEADRTAKAIVAIDERVKTLFRLVEDMPEQTAQKVVAEIWEKLRPRLNVAAAGR